MILLYWSTVEIVEARTGGIARENTIAIISSDTLVLVDSRDSRGEDRGLETSVERVTGQRNVYLLTVHCTESRVVERG